MIHTSMKILVYVFYLCVTWVVRYYLTVCSRTFKLIVAHVVALKDNSSQKLYLLRSNLFLQIPNSVGF